MRFVPAVRMILAGAAVIVLCASCTKTTTSAVAPKASVSNGLYPQVTPLCDPAAYFGAPNTITATYSSSLYGMYGTRYYVPVSGRAFSLRIYLSCSYEPDSDDRMKMAVYSDSGGKPDRLLAQTGKVRAYCGWNELDLVDVDLPVGWYWVVGLGYLGGQLLSGTGPSNFSFSASNNGRYIDVMPETFGSSSLTLSYSTRLYPFQVRYCP